MSIRTKQQSEALLAELEDVLRNAPPGDRLHHPTSENLSWLGRALAAIDRWDRVRGAGVSLSVGQLHSGGARETYTGRLGLMVMLETARQDIRMETLGPINIAVGHGLVFDYFDELRKQVESGQRDLLFIDPYLDAELAARYLPHSRSGVTIRLLARDKLATLLPAVSLFVQQHGAKIEVRSAPNFHDMYLIVDGMTCFQSGASFKDGGKNTPTTITQITDAFQAVHQTYEGLWQTAKIEV